MKYLIFSFFLLWTPLVYSEILEWSGFYRLEGWHVDNPILVDGAEGKTYALHHLVLSPKVVISDTMVLHTRFDILNTSSPANNQVGQFWGVGTTVSENGLAGQVEVSQAYLVFNQEFGSLVMGRTPVHFGLGMTHSSGTGIFDHWYDTRDLIGYKLMLGNFFVFPMVAKVEGLQVSEFNNLDILIHAQYESLRMNLDAGIFYWSRHVSKGSNDANGSHSYGTQEPIGSYSVRQLNLYFAKEIGAFRIAIEASQQSGPTGVPSDTTGQDIRLSGRGFAFEIDWTPKNRSQWDIGMDLGYASGDDLNTPNEYEGLIFDRNYDIALLMFNHPMGPRDSLQTSIVTRRTDESDITNDVDMEAISNTTYFSPYVAYRLSEKWLMKGRVIMGWLNENPLTDKSLGYEFNFHVTFSPNKYVNWVNGLGFFVPGPAFKGESDPINITFGLTSGLAIHF